jgi:hypothetical protein
MTSETPSAIISLGWHDVPAAGSCMSDGPDGGMCPARKVFIAQLARRGGLTIRLCERHLAELLALSRRGR